MAGKRDVALYLRDHSNDVTMNRVQAEVVIGLILEAIVKLTSEGENVSLHSFGLFKQVKRAGSQRLNPNTGDQIETPARTVLTFKASKATEKTDE